LRGGTVFKWCRAGLRDGRNPKAAEAVSRWREKPPSGPNNIAARLAA